MTRTGQNSADTCRTAPRIPLRSIQQAKKAARLSEDPHRGDGERVQPCGHTRHKSRRTALNWVNQNRKLHFNQAA